MSNQSMNNTMKPNTMTLTGRGQVTAVPDIAILRLGVQTTGENLTEIQNENANISTAVLQALQQFNIADIKTFQYDINRVFEYVDNRQIDKGYSVRNIFEIRLDNLDMVGKVIDTAVYYGANVVDLIEFEVSDTDDYYLQALNLAVDNGFQKANSISENLGILINPIPTQITENSASPIPFRSFAAREGAFTTPIEAGNKLIEASVTMEFIY